MPTSGCLPCPHCRGEMYVEPVHAGHEVPCPHCGESVLVPEHATLPPPVVAGADNSRGVLAFCFAILALLGLTCGNLIACPFGTLLGVFAPIAWKLAHDERAARRARGAPQDGLTEAGWITALVTTVLFALTALVTLGVIVFAGALAFESMRQGF